MGSHSHADHLDYRKLGEKEKRRNKKEQKIDL